MPSIRKSNKTLITQYLPTNLQMTPEQEREVMGSLEELQQGVLSQIPLRCTGADCRFAQTCPLQKISQAPIGKACPVEQIIIDRLVEEHVQTLGIDPSNSIELDMLYDLVEAEIFDMRTTADISYGDLYEWQDVGVDHKGNPITRKEVSLAFEVKDRVKRLKKSIREQFASTREIREKLKLKETRDAATIATDLVRRHMERQRRQAAEILDVETTDADEAGHRPDPTAE